VTAGEDGIARVWRTRDGKLVTTLDGKDSWLVDAQIDPRGQRIVTAGRNGAARLFSTSGELVRELRAGDPNAPAWAWNAAFSHDGSLVAIGDPTSGVARIFDAATGAPSRSISTSEPHVEIIAFSPTANRLATIGGSAVRLWGADGRALGVGAGHSDHITSLSFSRTGDRFLTSSWDRTARVWDGGTARPISVLQGHSDYLDQASFSPDGRLVATASRDDTARVWDPATGALRFTLVGHTGIVNHVEFDGGGSRVVTASADGTAALWSADTGARLASFQGHASAVQTASFIDDKHVVTTSLDGSARIWTTESGVRQLRGHTDLVIGVDVSSDGTRIVTSSADKSARIWDAVTGSVRGILAGHTDAVVDVHFSADGRWIVTASADHTAKLWHDGHLHATLPQSGEASVAAFTGDDTRVVVGSSDGSVSFWDVASAGQLTSARAQRGTIWAIETDSAGHVASSADDGSVVVWSSNGELLHRWSPTKAAVYATAISPDGTMIVTGSVDGTCSAWTLDGALVRRFVGHTGGINSVAFDGTGREIVTSSFDGTTRVWSLSGDAVAVLRGQGGPVRSAHFAAAGRLVVTAGVDGHIEVWDPKRESLAQRWLVHHGVISKAMLDRNRYTIASVGFDRSGSLRVLALDNDSSPRLAQLATCNVPFELKNGRLVPHTPSCTP